MLQAALDSNITFLTTTTMDFNRRGKSTIIYEK